MDEQSEIKRLKDEYLTLWDDFCVMRDRNVMLQKMVDELRAWKDSVPVDAINTLIHGGYEWVDHDLAFDAVKEWLASVMG